jgi:hypothetical protein
LRSDRYVRGAVVQSSSGILLGRLEGSLRVAMHMGVLCVETRHSANGTPLMKPVVTDGDEPMIRLDDPQAYEGFVPVARKC